MSLRIAVIGLVVGVTIRVPLSACSCLPDAATDCERYQNTEVVFVGEVTSAGPGSLAGLLKGRRHAVLRVTESFRGISEKEVEFTSDASSCSVDFKEGKSYLVFAWRDKNSGEIKTHVCAGTRALEHAQEQLAYIREAKATGANSKVFGFITRNVTDIELPFTAHMPVPGVRVTLRSENNSWQVVSDAEGKYEIKGLARGHYEISADLPEIPEQQTHRSFELSAEMCSRQNFLAVPVGQISGRVVDAEGNPLSGVLIEVEALPPIKQPRPILQRLTDTEGKFVRQSLEAGEYLLGLNLTSPPKLRDYYGERVPYARTYYPGVTDRSKAKLLRVEGGKTLENLVLRLPPLLPQVPVRGTVVWPDGSPVSASVVLMDLEYPTDSCQVNWTRSRSDGSFTVAGLAGRPYLVVASASRRRRVFQSHPLELQPGQSGEFRLVLSEQGFPDCKLVKRYRAR